MYYFVQQLSFVWQYQFSLLKFVVIKYKQNNMDLKLWVQKAFKERKIRSIFSIYLTHFMRVLEMCGLLIYFFAMKYVFISQIIFKTNRKNR